MVVHDLKTPMTVISGYVQLMALEEDRADAIPILREGDLLPPG